MSRRPSLVTGILLVTGLLGTSFALPARAQERSRLELLAKIDSIVEQAIDDGPIAGVSVGVRHRDETILAKGYGFADLENDVRATEHTVYRIGSITKQFIAALTMLLVEEQVLGLDDALATFRPGYPTNDNTVTVRHLLNHTSGIRSYTGLGPVWRDNKTLDLSHDELIGLFEDEPFDFPPGERYLYNNSGYYLLGVIIEQLTDRSYAEALRERIWNPLAMQETHYLCNAPIVKHRAEGYKVEDSALLNDDPLSMRQPFSAGALGSSVHDLLIWLSAFHGGRVVSDASYRQMTAPGSLNHGEPIDYGYGFSLATLDGHPIIAHGGGIDGFNTYASHYPDDDVSVVVLCNTSSDPRQIEQQIARLVLDARIEP